MTKDPKKQQPKRERINSLVDMGKALGRPTPIGPPPRRSGQGQERNRDGGNGEQVMMMPLRREMHEPVDARYLQCHPGLAFTKFVCTWREARDGTSNSLLTSFSAAGPQKKAFLQQICNVMKAHNTGEGAKLYEDFLSRRCRLFATLQQEGWEVKPVPLTTDWRLVSGLGIAHPFETGFVFDHTYGVPYLPGSSVKGAVRAWAEDTNELIPGQRRVVFGPDAQEEKRLKQKFIPAQGHVVFFDAYPAKWPELEVDILNPHYKKYYEDKTGMTPPADWLSPEPTYFLTVKAGTPWEFAVGVSPNVPRQALDAALADKPQHERTPAQLAEKAADAIKGAATQLGLGGKTAVGYGYFR